MKFFIKIDLLKLMILIFISINAQIIPAYSYVGPGMGAGLISIIVAFILCVVGIFVAIIWLPIKKMYLKFKKTNQTDPNKKEK